MDLNATSHWNKYWVDPVIYTSSSLTSYEKWIQIIVFYILLAGIFSSTGNIAMIIGIIRRKDMRSRFFIILCALLISRTAISTQMLIIGVYRLLRILQIIDTCQTVLICHSIHFHLYYAPSLEISLLLVLVLDRVLAIAAYKYYRNLTTRQAVITCCILSLAIVLVRLVPSYFGVHLNNVRACMNTYNPTHPIMNAVGQYYELSVAILVLILYLALIYYVQRRVIPENSGPGAGHLTMPAMRRRLKLLPLLRRIVLIHCSITLTAKITLLASLIWPSDQSERFIAYGGMLVAADIFVNVVALLVSNKELRQASLPSWCQLSGTGSSVITSSQT